MPAITNSSAQSLLTLASVDASANKQVAKGDFVNMLLGKDTQGERSARDAGSSKEKSHRDDTRAVSLAAPVTFYADDRNSALRDIGTEAPQKTQTEQRDFKEESAPRVKPETDDSVYDKPARTQKPKPAEAPEKPQASSKTQDDSTDKKITQDAQDAKPVQAPDESTAGTEPAAAPAQPAAETNGVAGPEAHVVVQPMGLPVEIVTQIQALLKQTKSDLAVAVAAKDAKAEAKIMTAFFQRFGQLVSGEEGTETPVDNKPATIQPAIDTSILALAVAPVASADKTPLPVGNTQVHPLPKPTGLPVAAPEAAMQSDTKIPALDINKEVAALAAALDTAGTAPREHPVKKQLEAHIDAAKDLLPDVSAPNAAVADKAKDSLVKQLHAVSALIDAAIPQHTNAIAGKPASLGAQELMQSAVAQAAGKDGQQQSSAGNEKNDGGAFSSPLPGVRAAGSQLAADSAQHSPFAKLLGQADKAPVLDQVAFNIKTMLKDGSSKINIRLDPAELGKVEIKLHVGADGKTGVSIMADNKDTLDLLKRDTSGLERALSDAGLKTDSGSLSFNLRGGSQENSKDQPGYANPYVKAAVEEDDALPINAINRSYVVNLAEGLDIKI